MSPPAKKVTSLLRDIDDIIRAAVEAEDRFKGLLDRVHPEFDIGARNLIHYRVLRSFDLRNLQKRLGNLGISRLAHIESHVLPTLIHTRSILKGLAKKDRIRFKKTGFGIKQGYKQLNHNALSLLGHRAKMRRTRIMVTLPSEAADEPLIACELIRAGMNVARINCAHDGPAAWEAMIANIRRANRKLKKNCKISMDLAGPKIRTGVLLPGPEVVKIRPTRDQHGRVTQKAAIWLSTSSSECGKGYFLPVLSFEADKLVRGKSLYLTDTRGRKRRLQIEEVTESGARLLLDRTTYFESGMSLYTERSRSGVPIVLDRLPALPRSIGLKTGDCFVLTSSPEAGFEGKRGSTGTFENEPRIACTAPEIFPHIETKETVLFDDGRIEGRVVEKNEDGLRIEVMRTDAGGGKLRADKGVNFPDSDIKISGLTPKDRTDLEFVVRYADIVNVSFVNRETDVEELFALLDKHRVLGKIGVILKIETRQGFNNLIRILLTAMQTHPVGVMIARGDLAVESGWNRIAWIQEEILSICQAAHIPDIWATQVLEALAKTGMPTRAEITDAAMGQRAECVMLNKGPKIVDAVRLLDGILKDAHLRQIKNTHLLPVLERVRDTATLGNDGEQTFVVHRDDGK